MLVLLPVNQVRSQDDANTSAVQVFILQMGTNATSMNNETAAARLELNGERDQELPMLSFSTIETATDYFAIRNILGEGGFGMVHKVNHRLFTLFLLMPNPCY